MTVHLPWIGVTSCARARALIEKYPQNVVGSFWIMCGYGFDEKEIPDWWINIVLEKNQAQSIVNAIEKGRIQRDHRDPLYLGFCIIVTANPSNPAQLTYMVQHLRMCESEGISLLRLMAKNNIPAITEVTAPKYFLQERYQENPNCQYLQKNLECWSSQVWEDYCGYLMSQHGSRMFASFCYKSNELKEQLRETLEESNKPTIFTEGETDPIYIKTALKLLNATELLDQVEIEWVGKSIGQGKNINSGDTGLNNTRNFFVSNPNYLSHDVLLLYDCDTKKNSEDHEKLGKDNKNLYIRQIPKQLNRKAQKGIENLFPDLLFKPEFYRPKIKQGNYGEENKIQEFQKMSFCKWICDERKNPEDFKDFQIIVDIIKEFLSNDANEE